MKAEVMSTGLGGKKKPKIRLLDLTFEAPEVTCKNGDVENGRHRNGICKGTTARHPLGLYSFDKDKDFHRQLRDDLDLELERETLGVMGGSPSWAIEAHKWPTHSGESPLLAHKFLSPSKIENVNGVTNLHKEPAGKTVKLPAPSSGSAARGIEYYRPSRPHPYLAATDPGQIPDCQNLVNCGRPTRSTLLRARHTAAAHTTSFHEMRRLSEPKLEEPKTTSATSNAKENLHYEVDGETFYSFLTGARYNRANYVDQKSLSQHGMYMPRHNPLDFFMMESRPDVLETTSAPPDSPRSDTEEGSSPTMEERRPTTAPACMKKSSLRGPRVPLPLPHRHTWGDAITTSMHVTNSSDVKKSENDNSSSSALDGDRVNSPKDLRIKGSRVSLNVSREGQLRFEGRLPSVYSSPLPRLPQLKETIHDNISESLHLPPTPVPTSAMADSSTLPPVRPETEMTKSDAQHDQSETRKKADDFSTPADVDASVSRSTWNVEEEQTEKTEVGEEREEVKEKKEEEELKIEEEEEKEEKREELRPQSRIDSTEKMEKEDDTNDVKDDVIENDIKDNVIDTDERTEIHTHPTQEVTEGATTTDDVTPTSAPAPEGFSPKPPRAASAPQPRMGTSDDVKFFLTQGAGVDTSEVTEKILDEALPSREQSARSFLDEEGFSLSDSSDDERDDVYGDKELTNIEKGDFDDRYFQREVSDGIEAPDGEGQGQGEVEPLKVIVTHIERKSASPVAKETEEEIIDYDT